MSVGSGAGEVPAAAIALYRALLDEKPGAGRVRLDFNYLYNPSCAYDDAWLCPLAPPENRVAAPIPAGELRYH